MEQQRVIRREGTGWAGVPIDGYVPGGPVIVERHTLIGERKSCAEDPGPHLEMRYFRLPAGKVSRLEKHEHEHYVIIGEGRGYAVVGERSVEVGSQDVVYVGPWEPHQFVNADDEPFGFFCIVTAFRDVSQELSPEELARLEASPAGAVIQPHGAPRPSYERKAAPPIESDPASV